VDTISHRELRNQSGRILRAVAAGESYTVTNNGTPVAKLVPLAGPTPDLRCTRPASRRGGFGRLKRYAISGSVVESLDDLRGER
jgi:prevent-host-death family protein